MKEVVLNGCYGGFELSMDGIMEVLKRKGLIPIKELGDIFLYGVIASDGNEYNINSFDREDKELIKVIKECGSEFISGSGSCLKIETYDDEKFTYTIAEYDGKESLLLKPVVLESKLVQCKDIQDILDYLESLNINVKRGV